ncbi:hypothetical protein BDV28DRAFT_149245 [Aspergillus coremiiformis]|uniref:F-box domain-containing protein n=1 Tax=Aspergillus coremiiformis TaxID=138285 RepID=A0A5N6Z822_9EURO|nr:hypothetical protein BDV28DRAFT_149245 [Aspergillus coremiiformis]
MLKTIVAAERACSLCGSSFNTRRIRTPEEPQHFAWGYHEDERFVNAWSDLDPRPNLSTWIERIGVQCPTAETGCYYILRQYHPQNQDPDPDDCWIIFLDFEEEQVPTVGHRFNIHRDIKKRPGKIGIWVEDLEHIASPGCRTNGGYCGYRITEKEMRGCQRVQTLLPKTHSYQKSPDDFEFEVNSKFFLSGLYDGLLNKTRLRLSVLGRRRDMVYEIGQPAFPFHPWCFGVYTQLSQRYLGYVEVDALCSFFEHIRSYNREFFYFLCPAISRSRDFQWIHHPGDEWLAANPYYVPKLRDLMNMAMDPSAASNLQSAALRPQMYISPTATSHFATTNPFAKLPPEINYMILDYLGEFDILDMRLVSRVFYQLPNRVWLRMIREKMPWLWEIQNEDPPYFWATMTASDIRHRRVDPGKMEQHLARWTMPKVCYETMNWFKLYVGITKHWGELKGLQNRRRIWNYQEKRLVQLEYHMSDIASDSMSTESD